MTKLERFKAAAKFGGIHNLTPHAVTVAGVTYPPSGIVARVATIHSPVVDGTTTVGYGPVEFFREGELITLSGYEFDGTVNIVSSIVLDRVRHWKTGVWVAPATGHPDVVRDDRGQIVSVPAFIL
jgi:hypothetical protein